ncbi:MAG TPA: hypothetical protein VIJ22_05050, partial [Polyangiaceae bacterium]
MTRLRALSSWAVALVLAAPSCGLGLNGLAPESLDASVDASLDAHADGVYQPPADTGADAAPADAGPDGDAGGGGDTGGGDSGAGCNSATDCLAGQACDPATHTCSTSCAGNLACNGGCCNAGSCAPGNTSAACAVPGSA